MEYKFVDKIVKIFGIAVRHIGWCVGTKKADGDMKLKKVSHYVSIAVDNIPIIPSYASIHGDNCIPAERTCVVDNIPIIPSYASIHGDSCIPIPAERTC